WHRGLCRLCGSKKNINVASRLSCTSTTTCQVQRERRLLTVCSFASSASALLFSALGSSWNLTRRVYPRRKLSASLRMLEYQVFFDLSATVSYTLANSAISCVQIASSIGDPARSSNGRRCV